MRLIRDYSSVHWELGLGCKCFFNVKKSNLLGTIFSSRLISIWCCSEYLGTAGRCVCVCSWWWRIMCVNHCVFNSSVIFPSLSTCPPGVLGPASCSQIHLLTCSPFPWAPHLYLSGIGPFFPLSQLPHRLLMCFPLCCSCCGLYLPCYLYWVTCPPVILLKYLHCASACLCLCSPAAIHYDIRLWITHSSYYWNHFHRFLSTINENIR